MHRYHQIAAEIFGYSYDRYADKLAIDVLRFSEFMPEDVRALEEFDRDGGEIEELADRLDRSVEAAEELLEDYRRAAAIVDAEGPVARFRQAVRQTVEVALDREHGRQEQIDFIVHQLGYRAADLGHVLDEEGLTLSDLSDELRLGSDYEPPAEPTSDDALREFVADQEAEREADGRRWQAYLDAEGGELIERIRSGAPVSDAEVDGFLEAFCLQSVPMSRPVETEEDNTGVSTLETLALQGRGSLLLEPMNRRWRDVVQSNVAGEAIVDYARLGRTLAVVEAAAPEGQIEGADALWTDFDQLLRDDRRVRYERLFEHASGRRQLDPDEVDADDELDWIDPAFWLAGETVPDLLDRGWSPAKAALALVHLRRYYGKILGDRFYGGGGYRTPERRERNKMRRLLKEAHLLVVDPDELCAYLDDLTGFDDRWPARRAILVEVLDPWLDHLEARGLLDGKLAKSLRYNLQDRLASRVDRLADTCSPRTAESLTAAHEGLY